MKHVHFDYVNKFSCLAGACPHTCCPDWQIILDADAIARYASLPGELGEQVRAAMLTENGETRFREQDGKCVLLREDGLCPLQAAYGADMLCRTCFTHPRLTEEYGQTAELTLSVSCPEAARLLLEHDAPLALTETDDGGPVVPNELDPELYPALLAARTAAIRLAQDRARPVADRLALILLLARRVQRLLDEGRDELVPVLARRFLGKQYQERSLVRLARLRSRNGRFFPCWMVLNNMEHLTRRFEAMLDAVAGQDAPPASFREEFTVQYENLLVYFLFRLALKAVNDRQYLARIEMCVFHLLCLRELGADAKTVQELTAAASLYSKEVEHSEENQALLLKLFRRGTLRWQYLASILDL